MNTQFDSFGSHNLPPLPTFKGGELPLRITIDAGDYGEETTRRAEAAAFFSSPSRPLSESTSLEELIGKKAPTTSPCIPSPNPSEGNNVWKLMKVPELPEHQLLADSSTFVPHTEPAQLAKRLRQIFKTRSIEAHLVDSKTSEILCLTFYAMEFSIFLYRGLRQYSHGIVVEIQRGFGTPGTMFSSDVNAIFHGVLGLDVGSVPLVCASLPIDPDAEQIEDNGGVVSLKTVNILLAQHAQDSHILALTMLGALTDATKVGTKTSQSLSQAVLADQQIFDRVIRFVKTESDGNDRGVRMLAMVVLGNACLHIVGKVASNVAERLRSTLIIDLQEAKTRTQYSYLACKCCISLIPHDHRADCYYRPLRMAYLAGKESHALLEQAAKVCIDMVIPHTY